MGRLDKDRQNQLEPDRIKYAIEKINELGYEITFSDSKMIEFIHNGDTVNFYPYSGWHTGKSIKDGRGLKNLIMQLENG